MRKLDKGDALTADEFKEALRLLGWTQVHFAGRVGLTPTAVNRWAGGSVPVPVWVTEYLGLLLEIQALYGRYLAPDGGG